MSDQGTNKAAYAAQRHERILTLLREHNRVDATQLAVEFGVTGETVRKDFIQLERRGQLRRVHGGALPPESSSYEPAVASRTSFAAEKARIARRAIEELPDRGSVLLDAGSTLERFAELIPVDHELTVFTNTLPIALTLAAKPRLTVYTLGGRLRGHTLAEVDDWAMRSLSELNVDVAFLGTNGLSLERGLTTPDSAEAAIKRAMLKASQRRVFLTDSSKEGVVTTMQHAEISDMDLLISDVGLSNTISSALRERGVDLQLV